MQETNVNKSKPNDQYAKSVCYFLAEQLRVRNISLQRAAEIAQKVVDNINLIDNEQVFLKLIMDLTKDFDELFPLTERIQMSIHISERKLLEGEVLEFVEDILPVDTHTALRILQEAVKAQINKDVLRQEFPQFSQFLEKNKL
ncbi:MAG: hypothetical protein ABI643_00210 [Candidatus Doudnabacteria bacterium]